MLVLLPPSFLESCSIAPFLRSWSLDFDFSINRLQRCIVAVAEKQNSDPCRFVYHSVPEMLFQPMPLTRRAEPFNDRDWIFEIKWDGFRAVLYSDHEGVRLVSRNGNAFKSFPDLCKGLSRDLKGRRCTLDG